MRWSRWRRCGAEVDIGLPSLMLPMAESRVDESVLLDTWEWSLVFRLVKRMVKKGKEEE